MCIFTGPSVGVADTRIFARLTRERRQLLVYEMAYAAAGEMAMVLPLPIAARGSESSVRFISLAANPDFFDRLTRIIQSPLQEFTTLGGGGGAAPMPPLKVHEVGAFDASFVPSPADFGRLDPRFRLAGDLLARLAQYQDYGFAVFKLRDTGLALKRVHPMALDFETRLAGEVFIPTVHVHDSHLHERAWFDHVVFAQGKRCSVDLIGKVAEVQFMDGKPIQELEPQLEQVKARIQMRSLRKTFEDEDFYRVDWKIERSASPADDRYGVAAYIGTAHGYFWGDDAPVVDAAGSVSLQPGYKYDERWAKLVPYLDMESPLNAFGFSGILPNRDTRIAIE